MINGIIGIKKNQTQAFDDKGNRIPVTIIEAGPCPIIQIKTKDNDGYNAIKCGIGIKKSLKKPASGEIKKAGFQKFPHHLKEIKTNGEINKKIGEILTIGEIFKEGDVINIEGISKGKGFAGVVKRHHFKGGPKTHGQSDRERAPGSIGSTTTPGRVYKGKRMAGRMGGQRVTVKNLKIFKIDIEKNLLMVKGLVPGGRNSILVINKKPF